MSKDLITQFEIRTTPRGHKIKKLPIMTASFYIPDNVQKIVIIPTGSYLKYDPLFSE
jgi:hypothetical protein